ERAQSYGHLETLLTTALADRALTFRNLGWSGDTVYGDARSYFGPPKEGFDRLTKHLDELKPHILIIAYGAVAAFEGEAGLPKFIEGYKTLLAMCQKTGARVVLMSPPPAENLPAPLPNQEAHNDRLALYRDAIRQLAKEGNHGFADVFGTLRDAWADLPHPLTENGIHFTEAGYAVIARLIAKTLGIDLAPLGIEINASTSEATLSDTRMQAVAASPQAVNVQLVPTNAVPRDLTVKVTGLADGDYTITNEHRKLTRA
ncbi:MAG: SGNH/GDSL hydrolase family protein, partial [Verrucomicrobiales bacterium]